MRLILAILLVMGMYLGTGSVLAADCPVYASCGIDIKTESKLQDQAAKEEPRWKRVAKVAVLRGAIGKADVVTVNGSVVKPTGVTPIPVKK